MKRFYGSLKYYYEKNWGIVFILCIASTRVFLHNLAQIRTPKIKVLVPDFIYHWKQDFLKELHGFTTSGIIDAMFLGTDKYLSANTKWLFYKAGLTHLLVASGFNCWIVGYLFQQCSKPASSFFKNKKIEVLSFFTGALLFWFLSDQSPPVNRALLFVLIQTIIHFFYLKFSILRMTIIQYLISLIFFPKLFFSASFQLTYFAIYGIMAYLFLEKTIDFKRFSKLQATVLKYFLLNTSIHIFTTPITWIFFSEMNFTGILFNWIASPFVSIFIMPVSLLWLFLIPFKLHAVNLLFGSALSYFSDCFLILLQFLLKELPNLRYSPYRDF